MGVVAGELEARKDSVTWSLLLHVRLFLRWCFPFSLPSILPTALLNFVPLELTNVLASCCGMKFLQWMFFFYRFTV